MWIFAREKTVQFRDCNCHHIISLDAIIAGDFEVENIIEKNIIGLLNPQIMDTFRDIIRARHRFRHKISVRTVEERVFSGCAGY